MHDHLSEDAKLGRPLMPLAPRQETYLSYYCKDSQPVLARLNPSVPGASVWPAARMQPNQHRPSRRISGGPTVTCRHWPSPTERGQAHRDETHQGQQVDAEKMGVVSIIPPRPLPRVSAQCGRATKSHWRGCDRDPVVIGLQKAAARPKCAAVGARDVAVILKAGNS